MESLPAKLTSLFTESPVTESTWPWSMLLKITMLDIAPVTMSRIRKSKFNIRPNHTKKVEVVVLPGVLELESVYSWTGFFDLLDFVFEPVFVVEDRFRFESEASKPTFSLGTSKTQGSEGTVATVLPSTLLTSIFLR